MKNQFVKDEIVNQLKELGFNELCLVPVLEDDVLDIAGDEYLMLFNIPIRGVTYEQAINWLLEEHKIFISFTMHQFGKWYFGTQMVDSPSEEYPKIAKSVSWDIEDYPTIEEVKEASIIKAIEMISLNK